MTKREGIQGINEIEAAEKLTARGYTKKDCATCNSVGHVRIGDAEHMCWKCEGTGWLWQDPPASK